jgi:hypothetical protein
LERKKNPGRERFYKKQFGERKITLQKKKSWERKISWQKTKSWERKISWQEKKILGEESFMAGK